jgi:hypothetical protein
MRFLTTSMPLSSDAFSSSTASLTRGPSNVRAIARMLVVLPVPGGPANIILGMFPFSAITLRRLTTSSFPTMSSTLLGRYFSSCTAGDSWEDPTHFSSSKLHILLRGRRDCSHPARNLGRVLDTVTAEPPWMTHDTRRLRQQTHPWQLERRSF